MIGSDSTSSSTSETATMIVPTRRYQRHRISTNPASAISTRFGGGTTRMVNRLRRMWGNAGQPAPSSQSSTRASPLRNGMTAVSPSAPRAACGEPVDARMSPARAG